MTRAGAAARARAREGLEPAKPGRTSWVHGSKLSFMENLRDDYTAAAELGKVQAGRFYDEVADKYLKKYGYNTAWNGDLEDGQDIASDVDEDEDVDLLDPEVSKARSKYFDELRTKIGAWFRDKYGGAVKAKKNNTSSFKTLFDKEELAPPRPQRPRVVNFYSSRYYDDRVKSRFEARWAALSRTPARPGKPLASVAVRTLVTKECWEAESGPFKAEVQEALEKEYQTALDAYEIAVSGEAPTTPEALQIAIDNAAYYLQPFVNAIQECFKMNVSLLMCGPVPKRGGAIEMHSIHAGTSKGMVPRVWPDHDRAGFEATRNSFRRFSEQCFTTEERQAISLNGIPEIPEQDAPAPEEGEASGDKTHAPESEGDDREREPDRNPDSEEENDEPYAPPRPLARDLATAFEPNLAAEVALMLPEDRERFERRVMIGSLTDSELRRENTMAKNRHVMGEHGFPGPQSDVSRSVAAAKRLAEAEAAGKGGGDEGGKRKRRKAPAPVGSPRRTRGSNAAQAANDDERTTGDEEPEDPPRGDEDEDEERVEAAPDPPLLPPHNDPVLLPLRDDEERVESPRDPPLPPPRDEPPPLPPREDLPPRDEEGRVEPLRDPFSGDEDMPPPPGEDEVDPHDRGELPPAPDDDHPLTERPRPKPAYKGAAGAGDCRSDAEVAESNRCAADDEGTWQPEMRNAVSGFARLQKWGGEDWIQCVQGLIELERAWGFPAKGLLSVPGEGEGRPKEVATFMRNARKWGTHMTLGNESVGPRQVEGSFAHLWWNWWGGLQPTARKKDEELGLTRPEDLGAEGWAEVMKTHGRNGMSLVVGCLLCVNATPSIMGNSELPEVVILPSSCEGLGQSQSNLDLGFDWEHLAFPAVSSGII
ncbi:hypothetical protein K438DRAFT_1787635 [Mycena galopus ATCC 62051]|nr:hypothetical protein K438DRAFT_1787635 [Mycena galopus ATCC 62051]